MRAGDGQKARVSYWLDRQYEVNKNSSVQTCVAVLQKQFPWIMRFRLELYIEEYMREGEAHEGSENKT